MFSSSERHSVLALMVWITRGWNAAADGIYGAGNQTNWFNTYQQSSPSP